MNMPSPEARLAAQEELTALLHAQIKQLSLDMRGNFSEVRQHIQLGFQQAHAYIQEHIESTMVTKEDLRRVEADIASIKATQDQILQLLQQRSGE
jgi:hypothetical protein